MIPYFLLLGYIVIFLIFSKLVKSDLFFYLSFITLTLFSGLRFDVGTDFMSYSKMFVDFKNGDALFLVEPANMLIINIVNILNIDHQVIFFIYSVIIMSGIFYFIKKLSPSKELSILLFVTIGIFYFSTFNGIRQWVAISIMLIAIVKLIELKYLQFFLCIIIASQFHISSIILLVIAFFRFRFNKFHLIFILLGSILATEFFIFLINNSQYFIYLNELRFKEKGNSLLLSIYILILIYIPFHLGYFSKRIILNKQEIVLINMNLMSILILILGYQLNIDFLSLMRVNMYFQIQLIILIPIAMTKIRNQKVKIIFIYVGIIFMFFYYLNLVYSKGIVYKLVPYQTILDIL